MSVLGHHALLFEVAGGVVLVGALLVLTRKKKEQTVDSLTAEDMERIDSRLVNGDVARSESRFRRRYGVDARPKDFPKPRPDSANPAEPSIKAGEASSEDAKP